MSYGTTTTLAHDCRLIGFRANLRVRGRIVEANTGEKFTALIEDTATLSDPEQTADAQLKVYTVLTALADDVADPRVIARLTEEDGRYHKVLEYREARADMLTVKWFCEAQRA